MAFYEAAPAALGGTLGAGLGSSLSGLGSLSSLLAPLDWPRQSLWNLGRGVYRGLSGEGSWDDVRAAMPGVLGTALTGGLALSGVGLPAAIGLGSLLGGLGQATMPDDEKYKAATPGELVQQLGVDPESTEGALAQFGVGMIGDPLSWSGLGLGAAAGKKTAQAMRGLSGADDLGRYSAGAMRGPDDLGRYSAGGRGLDFEAARQSPAVMEEITRGGQLQRLAQEEDAFLALRTNPVFRSVTEPELFQVFGPPVRPPMAELGHEMLDVASMRGIPGEYRNLRQARWSPEMLSKLGYEGFIPEEAQSLLGKKILDTAGPPLPFGSAYGGGNIRDLPPYPKGHPGRPTPPPSGGTVDYAAPPSPGAGSLGFDFSGQFQGGPGTVQGGPGTATNTGMGALIRQLEGLGDTEELRQGIAGAQAASLAAWRAAKGERAAHLNRYVDESQRLKQLGSGFQPSEEQLQQLQRMQGFSGHRLNPGDVPTKDYARADPLAQEFAAMTGLGQAEGAGLKNMAQVPVQRPGGKGLNAVLPEVPGLNVRGGVVAADPNVLPFVPAPGSNWPRQPGDWRLGFDPGTPTQYEMTLRLRSLGEQMKAMQLQGRLNEAERIAQEIRQLTGMDLRATLGQ